MPSLINIGYISPDFYTHAVGISIYDMFKYHDRDKFKVFCYCETNLPDSINSAVRDSVDEYYDISDMADITAINLIKSHNIDILISLSGHTSGSRVNILKARPAKLQAHMYGQLSFMGAEFVDYFITSKYLMHDVTVKQTNTEQLVLLECLNMAYPKFKGTEFKATRAQYNLPEDKIVLVNFNQGFKLDKDTVDTWAKILKLNSDTVLWLNYNSNIQKQNLIAYFNMHGVERDRLVFREPCKINVDWHIELADIYVDALKISSGTPAVMALHKGVPVVTMPSNTVHSRFSGMLCTAAGLDDYIVNSTEDYIGKVSQLTKSLLKVQAQDTKLFNQVVFIRELEDKLALVTS